MFKHHFPFPEGGYVSFVEGTVFVLHLSSARSAIFTDFSRELAQEKESNAIKRCIALAIKRLSAEAPWLRNNGWSYWKWQDKFGLGGSWQDILELAERLLQDFFVLHS